jgi:hypothetical protein
MVGNLIATAGCGMFVHLDLVDGCDNLRAVGRQEHVNWNHEYNAISMRTNKP